MIRVFVIFILFLLSFSFSEEVSYYDLRNKAFMLKFKEEGTIKPDPELGYTFAWTKNFFSRVRFLKSVYTETGRVEGFPQSRLSTTFDETVFQVIPAGYRFHNLEFSAGITYMLIDRLEFGYIYFPPELGDEWVAFENRSEIEFLRPHVSVEYKRNIVRGISLYLFSEIYPFASGKLYQETFFKPIVQETAVNDTDIDVDFSYKIGGSVSILFRSISLGFFGEIEFLEYEYYLNVLDKDENNNYFFSRVLKRSEQERVKYGFILSFKLFEKNLFIGYLTEEYEQEGEGTLKNNYIMGGTLF